MIQIKLFVICGSSPPPTNAQLDLPEVEHEHMHLRFLDACEGKRQIIGITDNQMVDHHTQVHHARS
jgi:hypothetical protein